MTKLYKDTLKDQKIHNRLFFFFSDSHFHSLSLILCDFRSVVFHHSHFLLDFRKHNLQPQSKAPPPVLVFILFFPSFCYLGVIFYDVIASVTVFHQCLSDNSSMHTYTHTHAHSHNEFVLTQSANVGTQNDMCSHTHTPLHEVAAGDNEWAPHFLPHLLVDLSLQCNRPGAILLTGWDPHLKTSPSCCNAGVEEHRRESILYVGVIFVCIFKLLKDLKETHQHLMRD